MVDMTDAEYAGTPSQTQFHKVPLAVLDEKSDETIFNVIIMDKDKEKADE